MPLPRRPGRAATAAILAAVAAPWWATSGASSGATPGVQADQPADLRIDDVEVRTDAGWTEWFGIPSPRELAFTIRNDSSIAFGPGRVNLTIGDERAFVPPTDIHGLAPRQSIEVAAPFSLGWAQFGDRRIRAEVRVGTRPAVSLDRSTSVPPPIGLAGLALAGFELAAWRRRRDRTLARRHGFAVVHPAQVVLRELDAGLRRLDATGQLLVAIDASPRQLWRARAVAGRGVRWFRADQEPPAGAASERISAHDDGVVDELMARLGDYPVGVTLHFVADQSWVMSQR